MIHCVRLYLHLIPTLFFLVDICLIKNTISTSLLLFLFALVYQLPFIPVSEQKSANFNMSSENLTLFLAAIKRFENDFKHKLVHFLVLYRPLLRQNYMIFLVSSDHSALQDTIFSIVKKNKNCCQPLICI